MKQGAFKCLVEAGEVAFLKHTTVVEMITTEQYGTIKVSILLCSYVNFRIACIISIYLD
jgi:hypothetical protein